MIRSPVNERDQQHVAASDTNEKTIMVNSEHIIWFETGGEGLTELHVTYYGGDRNITIQVKQKAEGRRQKAEGRRYCCNAVRTRNVTTAFPHQRRDKAVGNSYPCHSCDATAARCTG
ncbi:hypothetical protein [Mesorhizobium sp. A556]